MDENIRGLNAKNYKYSDKNLSELKKWFIDEAKLISEDTKVSYENLMCKVADYENNFTNGKELHDFTYDELLDMFSMFGSSSVNTLNVYLSIVRKYIDFAIQKGYVKSRINLANNIGVEKLGELINQTKKQSRFVMREDLYYLVEENLVNEQDQAMILLIFEGIKGVENSELVNLKRDDIDVNSSLVRIFREIKEKDENGNTEIVLKPLNIKVPRRLMNLLEATNNQTIYQMNNGNYGMNGDPKRTGDAELSTHEDTPYFLRPIKVKDVHGGKLTNAVIQKRVLTSMKEYINLPFATVNSIYMSGILDRLCRHTEELEKDILTYTEVDEFLKKTYESVNTHQTYTNYKDYLVEWRSRQGK